jgi:hypothetical protein
MLDDLRNSAAGSFQEEEKPQQMPAMEPVATYEPRQPAEPFLGMTPQQRFAIALMLFLMVSVLGVLLLVVSEKVFIF